MNFIVCVVALTSFICPPHLGGEVPDRGIVNRLKTHLHFKCMFSSRAPTWNCKQSKMNKLQHSLQDLYQKQELTKLQVSFLSECKQGKVIPKGLQLTFNITGIPSSEYLHNVQTTLHKSSSRLLDETLEEKNRVVASTQTRILETRQKLQSSLGVYESNRIVGRIKQTLRPLIAKRKMELHRKFLRLSAQPEKNKTFQGSTKMRGTVYDQRNRTDPFPKEKRPHRSHRHKKANTQKVLDSQKRITKLRTADDPSSPHPFDPIVTTDIKLTPAQIEICRLPDCFAPSPRQPIDVFDQLSGTHAWAERLRWHFFHYQQKKKSDDQSQDEDTFTKRPWYKPTSKSAPRNNPALETFIKACQEEFLDCNKRRKTKDNLSHEQRMALRDLKNLPLTKNCACRFADKTGNTVITALDKDDETISETLSDPNYYDILPSDPTPDTIKLIKQWSEKWFKGDAINEEMADYITNISDSHPSKCKPLVKTHKAEPYPTRLLLSGCGTPIQPLSKFVQICLSHLTQFLPFQVIDSKEFLQKVDKINRTLAPLPDSACFAVCDVISLYPNVNNDMGVPATEALLSQHPTPLDVPAECVLEALTLSLENNAAKYTNDTCTIFAKPNHGIAMGPPHACDFVDIFMGQLDNKLVESCPVPLLADISPNPITDQEKTLSWSRFRDDAITILPDSNDAPAFGKFLQELNPPSIKWTIQTGTEVEYLDIKLKLENGTITTDVFSKNCNSYLPPTSCHAPSVFKGLISGVGTRLRMLCSDDETLQQRIKEYAGYFELSGWNRSLAERELARGAEKDRLQLLTKPRKRKGKKHAWVTMYDPRYPSKAKILKENLHLLYSDKENRNAFPPGSIIAADRRRKNLGEIYKPTIPRRFVEHGPRTQPGFQTCAKRCDTCAHATNIDQFTSPWDHRLWKIRKTLSCTTPNTIYVIRCKIHPHAWYIGSTRNLKHRWAGHKSDINLKKNNKCQVAYHMNAMDHPSKDRHLDLEIFPIDTVRQEQHLGKRELWWMTNVGTLFCGLNVRMDFNTMLKNRIQYSK